MTYNNEGASTELIQEYNKWEREWFQSADSKSLIPGQQRNGRIPSSVASTLNLMVTIRSRLILAEL